MPRNHKPTEFDGMADALIDLFDDEDQFVLLTGDGSVYGGEGIPGLRLIANALFEAECEPSQGKDSRFHSSELAPAQPGSARLDKIKKQIAKHAKSGIEFVLAYQIHGTTSWQLAWSADLEQHEAIERMLTFVTAGMDFATV